MSLLHDKLHVTAIEPMAAGEDISSPLAEEAEEKNGGQEMRSRISNKSPAKGLPAKHRVRHRKQRQGQTIFKGHPSWKMVINIKLGVSYTVGRQEDTVYTHICHAQNTQLPVTLARCVSSSPLDSCTAVSPAQAQGLLDGLPPDLSSRRCAFFLRELWP